jgi:hypothetical protein
MKRPLILVAIAMVAGLAFNAMPVSAQEPPIVIEGASLLVTLDTNPETNNLDFEFYLERDGPGDPGEFELEDDEDISFDLVPDEYTLTIELPKGWVVDRIDCDPIDVDEDEEDGTVTLDLDKGDEAECLFVVKRAEATPTPTATPVLATPVPAPTQPATIPCVIGNDVVVLVGTKCPVAPVATSTPAPAPVVPVAPVSIRPPSTGSGGLLDN